MACKKCRGTGFVQLTKGIRYRGHLLMGGVSVRCDHQPKEKVMKLKRPAKPPRCPKCGCVLVKGGAKE